MLNFTFLCTSLKKVFSSGPISLKNPSDVEILRNKHHIGIQIGYFSKTSLQKFKFSLGQNQSKNKLRPFLIRAKIRINTKP